MELRSKRSSVGKTNPFGVLFHCDDSTVRVSYSEKVNDHL